MALIDVAFNVDTNTAYLVYPGASIPSGSVKVGSFEHEQGSDTYGDPITHVHYQHVRDILYRCSRKDPTQPAMFPDSIFDITNITILVAGMPIIRKETITSKEVIPFTTNRVNNPNLETGTENVSVVGVNGERTIVTEITYTDGVETDRQEISNEITIVMVPQEVQVGTRVSPTKVVVAPKTASIEVDAETTLAATVTPSNATNKAVTYASSDTGVATVTNAGLVKGVAAGTATITVKTTLGGKTDTSVITVTEPEETGTGD